jgi:hypothetical protein
LVIDLAFADAIEPASRRRPPSFSMSRVAASVLSARDGDDDDGEPDEEVETTVIREPDE